MPIWEETNKQIDELNLQEYGLARTQLEYI